MYSYPLLPWSFPTEVHLSMGEGLFALSFVTLFGCVMLLIRIAVERRYQTKTVTVTPSSRSNDRELEKAA
jgi:hypothetical protein